MCEPKKTGGSEKGNSCGIYRKGGAALIDRHRRRDGWRNGGEERSKPLYKRRRYPGEIKVNFVNTTNYTRQNRDIY